MNFLKQFILCYTMFLVFSPNCKAQQNKLEVTGNMKGLVDNEVVTLTLLTDHFGKKFTTEMFAVTTAKNSEFHLSGLVNEGPRLFYLDFSKHLGRIIVLALDNEKVLVSGDLTNLPSGNITDSIVIQGSKSNYEYSIIKYLDYPFSNLGEFGNANSYSRKLIDSLGNKSSVTQAALEVKNYFSKTLIEFVNDHPENHAIPILLSDIHALYLGNTFLGDIYKVLDEKARNSFYGKQIQEIVQQAK